MSLQEILSEHSGKIKTISKLIAGCQKSKRNIKNKKDLYLK